MTGMLTLYIAIFAAVLAALLVRSRLANHLLIGLAGAIGLFYGLSQHGLLATVLPFLILVVAGVQAASVLAANRVARFSDDDRAMLDGPLAELSRSQARRMLDQGMWMDGREGDVLTREGERAGQLYFLADGRADVHAHDRLVARLDAGQLIGEATVLGDALATATVTLSAPSRFWCAPGPALNAYLAANPDARHALEHSFNISLRGKLEAMNRAAADDPQPR
ncbi:MAG: cyclic nucleotide-binding domain-containing protein [Sphingomonas sp.]|uniref:cyclic nucleotide-binding domain-containing protein n=1 Tax=Sphingomonas sp. TaxID=28214 RepID=UPI0017928EB8|nr:cyclic nucleotide-binding domain-containing protein [Sphingomonas sp.]MBA3667339.1 cyclic nucleotide-binding domain-containing protein [Sphingomonas sp.]